MISHRERQRRRGNRFLLLLLSFLLFTTVLDAQRLRTVRRPVLDQVDAGAWLRQNALRLDSVEAGAPLDDLALLEQWLGDAKVIGLGDGSHGTREFYTVKHRILELLVERLGVRTIAFEGPAPRFNALTSIARGSEGDPREVLSDETLWWFWNTEEIAELVEWARAYNAAHPSQTPIELRGVDSSFPELLIEDLDSFFSTYLPAERWWSDERLACFRNFLRYPDRTVAEQDSCRAGLAEVQEMLESRRAELEQLSTADRAWEAIQGSRMILQAERMHRERVPNRAIRDETMAANVETLVEERSHGGPVIFWAHSGHVYKADLPDLPEIMLPEANAAGVYLAESFGVEYYVIGTITLEGKRNTLQYPDVVPMSYPPSPSGSYENLMASAGYDVMLVPLHEPAPRWLQGPRPMSFGMAGSAVVHVPVESTEVFDALVFIRNTTPTEYLGSNISAEP